MAERSQRRVELADGKATTVHVVAYELAAIRPRVVRIAPETPVDEWCAQHGIRDAVSGGFSVKPEYQPLGELWTEGRSHEHQPFQGTWAERRGAFAVDGRVSIDYRDALPVTPERDLMQAGPLLVRDGRSAIAGVDDPEGFSATSDERDDEGEVMAPASPSVTAIVLD